MPRIPVVFYSILVLCEHIVQSGFKVLAHFVVDAERNPLLAKPVVLPILTMFASLVIIPFVRCKWGEVTKRI
jgi:hypothetical protein